MGSHNSRFSIITDERAEGSVPAHEPEEAHREGQRAEMPPKRLLGGEHGPASETGLLPQVVLGESAARDETQDRLRTTAETTAMPHSHPAPDVKWPRPPRVLIIEDTPDLAEILRLTLERMQIVVFHEDHGARALERIQAVHPDLMLLDINLPDTSGWKILETLKETQREGGVMPAVIVITAFSDAANRLVGRLQNVHSYLVKPFTASEVERAVMEALHGRVG